MTNKENHPCVIWFTGLSGSGKSTLAEALEKEMIVLGYHIYLLDGDKVRNGLNSDLNFEPKDRSENIRRIGEVAAMFLDAKVYVIGAFISPYEKDRELVRRCVGAKNFIEVYVNTTLNVCEQRDVKGLYKKARAGEIINFTGIDAPYEVPKKPDLEIDTSVMSVHDVITTILKQVLNI